MKRLANLFLLFATLSAPAVAGEWNDWLNKKSATGEIPVVTNRAVTKSGRFQILVPQIGILERKDFYSHYTLSGAVRYHLAERHSLEILRVQYDYATLSAAGEDVYFKTPLRSDARQGKWSVSAGYYFSPLYGKYAVSESSLVHFDAYFGLSLGVRLAEGQTQITAEPVVGVSHYLSSNFALILPELRAKFYSEERSGGGTLVTELQIQVGAAWLF